MLQISEKQVKSRLKLDNPWWNEAVAQKLPYHTMPHRHYFPLFLERVSQVDPVRALILMGPRRVGKTTMVHQVISQLIETGIPCENLMYVAIDAPIYNGLSLEQLLNMFFEENHHDGSEGVTVFFDEIQYLKDWEVHLKSLVDTYPRVKFVASGSAAAALKVASVESGAGRFTDFFLPPLTFAEYLEFIEVDFHSIDVKERNKHLVDYVNFGGYPEAVLSPEVQKNPGLFIKNDIIDKVLLRDLPSLYGIKDIQELNRLFTLLAYNTAQEVSVSKLSKESGIAKNTINKYIGYLEAAFLIFRVHRVDRDARNLKRITNFKVYLTNPSMRSALFNKIEDGESELGSLIETGLYSQWLHSRGFKSLFYTRFGTKHLEVDVVCKSPVKPAPEWVLEIKWSDKSFTDPSRIMGIIEFCQNHGLSMGSVTTKTVFGQKNFNGVDLRFTPTSSIVYSIGRGILENMSVEDTNRISFDS